jgi:hypothetical protein
MRDDGQEACEHAHKLADSVLCHFFPLDEFFDASLKCLESVAGSQGLIDGQCRLRSCQGSVSVERLFARCCLTNHLMSLGRLLSDWSGGDAAGRAVFE